jgi:cytohesin
MKRSSTSLALHKASKEGNISMVKKLVKEGADITSVNNQGQTPLDIARKEEHLEIIHFLVSQNGTETQKKHTNSINNASELLSKINLKDKSALKTLKKSASKSVENEYGDSLLMKACRNKYSLATIKAIIKEGGDVNHANDDKETALMFAVCHAGYTDVIKYLLKKGANSVAKDKNGMAPLHIACFYHHLENVKVLLKTEMNVDIRNNDGQTPLMISAGKNKSTDIIKYLIKKGSLMNSRDNHGNTALHFATMERRLDNIKVLGECGASLNIKNKDGKQPIDIAQDKDYTELVPFLLRALSSKKNSRTSIS